MAGIMFSGEVDPEIADLVGLVNRTPQEGVPDFKTLFNDQSNNSDVKSAGGDVDLTTSAFEPITQFEDPPQPFFADKDYYQKTLSGENEPAHKFHEVLGCFLKSEDPQEKSHYRQRLIPAFWDLAQSITEKISGNMPIPKRFLIRFGLVLPMLISAEQRNTLSKIILENRTGEPVYYADEWLKSVCQGKVVQSATDETKIPRKNSKEQLSAVVEKTRGKYDAQIALIKSKVNEMETFESLLQEKLSILVRHDTKTEFGGLKAPMNSLQKQSLSDMNEIFRKLSTIDRDLTRFYSELEDISSQLGTVQDKASGAEQNSSDDSGAAVQELNTLRQMAKMCVGRQGNHFPILMKQYFRSDIRDLATRENVLSIMANVERLDQGLFYRTFKQQTHRIVPNIIIVPCYGDGGICWEPFERFNRATSRGRVAIPFFPKELKPAVIAALGDLRWQVAKERAQHYWMEEGLTGWYYQWFSEKKMKGDVREAFIQDYILWILKESEGTQKLDRDVRDIFWRYIPFPQDVKENLKNRGFVYSELCKKDQNRSLSDGY